MSLTRRLQLALAILLLLAVAINLWLQLQRTRDFLALQLQSHAQDTATSLALSLSPALAANDQVMVERMIDAVFDRGYYRQISWLDVNEQPVLSRSSTVGPQQIPDWFLRALPIQAPQASALLSSGWNQQGTLLIESHVGYAQLALWRSFVDLAIGSLVALFALGVLVLYTVQRALAPLHRMAEAAHQFVSRRAPMQLPSAVVAELQPLALALGQMSEQVAAQFAAQAGQLHGLQTQLQHDAVTQLPNRLALLDQLSELENQHHAAVLIGVRLSNLASINAERGYAGTNAALQALTEHLNSVSALHWFRLSGSEFVALSAVEQVSDTTPTWLQLPAPWQAVAVQLQVQANSGPSAVLARLDAAMNEAKQRNLNWWPLASGESLPAEAWRKRLQDAIALPPFRFLPAQIEALSERCQPAVEWLARLPQADGELLTAGQLLAQARRLGLETELEAALLTRLAQLPKDARRWHVNINASALITPSLRQQLSQLARDQQLSLELSENEALALPELSDLLRPLRVEGIGFGLDQVSLSAGLLAVLPHWRPDYLKLGLGLAGAGADSALISSLVRLAQALDIAVLVPVAAGESTTGWRNAGVDGVMHPPQ
jgi:EAL domain-containing protein (putative c-di-GMP-specific phosphodiesterase class I)/GGDEF domain-containing protein